ncbi:hypothetical protein ABIA94_002273 [Bradyrhizobium sp. LA7.1]
MQWRAFRAPTIHRNGLCKICQCMGRRIAEAAYGGSASLVFSNEAGSTNGDSDISANQSRMSVEGIARRGVQGLMVSAVTMYPCSNFWRANLWASSSVRKLSLCLERRCADALRTSFGTSNETYHAFGRLVGTGLSDLLSLWARLPLRTRSRNALSAPRAGAASHPSHQEARSFNRPDAAAGRKGRR